MRILVMRHAMGNHNTYAGASWRFFFAAFPKGMDNQVGFGYNMYFFGGGDVPKSGWIFWLVVSENNVFSSGNH